MLKIIAPLVAAAVLSFAGSASAAIVYQVTYQIDGMFLVDDAPDAGPSKYRAEFKSSDPILEGWLTFKPGLHYNKYDVDGVNYEGNDNVVPVTYDVLAGGPIHLTSTGFWFDYVVPEAYRLYHPGGQLAEEGYYDALVSVELYFAEDGSLNPATFTLTAVPEPATWAMMIIGFGLAGAGLRRNRLSPQWPSPSQAK